MPAKVLLKEYKPTIVFLRKTDANFATNSHNMTFQGHQINVVGFVGVETPTSNVINGALKFSYNGQSHEVVFSVNPAHGGTVIQMTTYGNLIGDQYRQAIKDFLNSTRDKILARMIQRDLNPNQTGGGGLHPRLEGRRRTSGQGPQTDFATAVNNQVFTADFVAMANLLAIHYR